MDAGAGPAGLLLRLAADAPGPHDFAAAIASVPTAAGVVQILGPDGRPLVTARAANVRRYALGKLGPPRPAAPGRRPPTNLRPLASAVRYAVTTSPFHQRLVYERWLAPLVPLLRRRDLKPPAYLHLDPRERFPRVSVRDAVERDAQGPGALFGPFRDKRAAERAMKPLHKLFPLRPCDFVFEPDPELPLGLGCLYAQVRSCAAPCLRRVGEEPYRALARRAAEFLADPDARSDEARAWLPAWVSGAGGAALVVERTPRAVELYPVRAGAVLEEHALRAEGDDAFEQALARLDVVLDVLARAAVPAGRDDAAWLSAYFHSGPRGLTYVPLADSTDREALARRLRAPAL